LLREHNIASFLPNREEMAICRDLTADFVYVRLHGDTKLYVSGYSDRAIDWWTKRLEMWRKGKQPAGAKLVTSAKPDQKPRDLFVYFDNDAKVHAPFDAQRLGARLFSEKTGGSK